MAKFILKDWYGNNCEFDHDKIFVQDVHGELIPFTQGEKPVFEELNVTDNGRYTPSEGVDGFNVVSVDVPAPEIKLQTKTITENGTYHADPSYDGLGSVEVNVKDEGNVFLLSNFEVTGFAEDSKYGAYSKDLTFGTDLDSFGLSIGREYSVGWDDELYTVYAKDTGYIVDEVIEEYGELVTIYHSVFYLGNGALLGIDRLEDSGEPFVILWTQSKGLTIVTTSTAESHVLGLIKRSRPQEIVDMLLQSVTITENGTYTADSFYDGLKQVVVDVAGAGASDDVRYITFMSHDGTIEYGKKAVAVGDDCADPIARGIFDTPTRESDAQYNYTHNGWATEPNGVAVSSWNKAITEDKTVYASFASAVRYYTITYYDSDGTTVLKTESLAYGSTPSYAPTKEGYNFSAWSPTTTTVISDASYIASWIEKVGFDAVSWAKIAEIAESGNASSVFALGDTKVVTIGEKEIGLRIIGFNHDTLSDGSGKAGLTIMAYQNIPALQYDTRQAYADDIKWSNCGLRANLNGEYLATFPADLQAVIKAVDKISDGGHKSNTLVTTSDKVWIPSYEETGNIHSSQTSLVTQGQGTKYAGMSLNTTCQVTASTYKNTFATRTIAFEGASSNGPGKYFRTRTGGNAYYSVSNVSSTHPPVAFCFCI